MSVEHIREHTGWQWSDAMNDCTAFAKAPNVWTQIKYNICGRRAAFSPMWWWPCNSGVVWTQIWPDAAASWLHIRQCGCYIELESPIVQIQQETYQLVGPSKTPRHSIWTYLQTFCVSFVVILRQTLADLFDSLLTEPVFRTFMHYSITFCSRLEANSDIVFATRL